VRHALTHARRTCAAWLRRLFAENPLHTGRLSIARVRFAFGSLLCMLLGGVLLLLDTALDRLERERVMRHEVVAARVFDELERELNAHLERESARPSSVYDAPSSQVERWAPYVVGYFTVDDDYRVLSRAQLPAARSARIQAALSEVWPDPRHSFPTPDQLRSRAETARAGSSADEEDRLTNRVGPAEDKERVAQKQLSKVDVSKELAPKMKPSKALDNSPEVLRRLNRAQEVRRAQSKSQSMEDPFAF